MRLSTILLVLVSCAARGAWAEPTADELAHFEQHIRPSLASRCEECHNASEADVAANLRLDYAGGWLAGGDSGPAVDVDKPLASLMLRAIEYQSPDLQMPPKSKLPERELALLREWIAAGAPAPSEQPDSPAAPQGIDIAGRKQSHWAWQPIVRPALPAVTQHDWPRDDLDRFVLAKLEAAGLAPAAEASPEAWLRRVYFDLTGLPPKPDDVRQFVADPSEAARGQVVDRLLASRAFAECWAQHWLDLMRFAETKGHEQDFEVPHAWRYRDYVIRALDANVPLNQFIVEHIAGDLVSPPRIDPATRTNQSVQGTAFWHLGEATHSPVDIRGEEADRIDNQIDVFGKAFLGLTIACARCHDHKFDAISTADYYALCGYLQSSSYVETNVADPEATARIAESLAALHQAESPGIRSAMVESLSPAIEKLVVEWRQGQLGPHAEAAAGVNHPLHVVAMVNQAPADEPIEPLLDRLVAAAAEPAAGYRGEVIVDFARTAPSAADRWLTNGHVFGDRPTKVGEVTVAEGVDEAPPTANIVAHGAASSSRLSPRLTGIYRTPTFVVTEPSVWYLYRGSAEVFLDVDSHRTVAGPLHTVCRQKLERATQPTWFRHPAGDYVGHSVHVDFRPAGDFELLAVVVASDNPQPQPQVNREIARELATIAQPTRSAVADAVATALRRALDGCLANTLSADQAALVNWMLDSRQTFELSPEADNLLEQAVRRYVAARRDIDRHLPREVWSLALMDGSAVDEFVHLRGSHKRLAETPTPRRFLEAFDGQVPTCSGSGRLELARSVISPTNPLPARVHVNRVWAYLTGRGLVKTVDNFGVLGEPPTHPELLDYLADEFVASGWDTKQLVRRVVLSSSYRQSTHATPAARQHDPANTLLHAARVRRLPAEAIRDSLLVVAGKLDDTSFGPSVRIHITDFMRHNRSPGWSGPLDGDRRRSIYVEVRRNALSHFLTAFDRPQPFSTVGLRHTSNSPAQPLTLLNDPLVHQLAGEWGSSLASRYDRDDDALDEAYLAAFARTPDDAERARMLSHLATAESRERGWSEVCLVLINSKEFIYLR
jgi:cytochrome c553